MEFEVCVAVLSDFMAGFREENHQQESFRVYVFVSVQCFCMQVVCLLLLLSRLFSLWAEFPI